MLKAKFKNKIESLVEYNNHNLFVKEIKNAKEKEEFYFILFASLFYFKLDFNKKILEEININNDDYEYLLDYIFEKGLEIEKAEYFLSKITYINHRRVINLFLNISDWENFERLDDFINKYLSSKPFVDFIKRFNNKTELKSFLSEIESIEIENSILKKIKSTVLKNKIENF